VRPNYAVTAYDSARVLLDAISRAAVAANGLPSREQALQALRQTCQRGVAYRDPIRWDANGDNINSVTALHEVRGVAFISSPSSGIPASPLTSSVPSPAL
jgi:branched-chain amino acid transport system substrate-binding protein